MQTASQRQSSCCRRPGSPATTTTPPRKGGRSGQARASGSTASYAWHSYACAIRLTDRHDVRSGHARDDRGVVATSGVIRARKRQGCRAASPQQHPQPGRDRINRLNDRLVQGWRGRGSLDRPIPDRPRGLVVPADARQVTTAWATAVCIWSTSSRTRPSTSGMRGVPACQSSRTGYPGWTAQRTCIVASSLASMRTSSHRRCPASGEVQWAQGQASE